jgi:DNA-binding transcriptional ArsR family regulator
MPIDRVIRIFKALGCANRLKILKELAEGEKCLCELAEDFSVDISTISRHVGELVRLGLIREEKRGNKKFFSVADPRVMELINLASEIAKGEVKT